MGFSPYRVGLNSSRGTELGGEAVECRQTLKEGLVLYDFSVYDTVILRLLRALWTGSTLRCSLVHRFR